MVTSDLDIYSLFRDRTMVPQQWFTTNLALARSVREVPGAIVECGVWRGGMIAGIAMTVGADRVYWLFDSFEGLPDARPVDGPAAAQWQANTAGPYYYDNCTASEEEAAESMLIAGVPDVRIRKGWFEDTLPTADFAGGIALLRLDGDWYASTRQALTMLFPRVNEGGIVIVDDYYTWDGCSRAVHEYLSEHSRPERIETMDGVCVIRKRADG
jgi:hypothetical protein